MKKPTSIDAYLRTLAPAPRAALEQLRRRIRALAPHAAECINYGVPTFQVDGRNLVHFAAAAKHLSFFPGARPIAEHADALAGFSTSKGTVRFTVDEPLPAALVRRLVATRLAELAERTTAKAKPASRAKATARAKPRTKVRAGARRTSR